jgi:asparagine synthase (glutamine-hydrolysing)
MSLVGSCEELKAQLFQTLSNVYSQSILLSGGLDSSILASVVKPRFSVTIGFEKAEDFTFADIIANEFCKVHIKVLLDHETLLSIISKLIGLMKTFDPIEIRNSCVLYAGIEESKRRGYSCVITGDGCDELFAGYNYMRRHDGALNDLEAELHRIWRIMHFSAKRIGKALGVTIWSPYLDNPFLEYAKGIDISEKVGYYKGKRWGKFILRKCFEKDIGKWTAWRPKQAQERGANISLIANVISQVCDDEMFVLEREKAMSEGVIVKDKEHLYYYLLYRRKFPVPRMDNEYYNLRCPKCQCPFIWEGNYCRTCGSYPVSPYGILA